MKLWCSAPLRFDPARSWVHPEGGGYVVEYRKCGWKGASHPSPRRVNHVCANSPLAAFIEQKKLVDQKLVLRVIQDLNSN